MGILPRAFVELDGVGLGVDLITGSAEGGSIEGLADGGSVEGFEDGGSLVCSA